MSAALPHHHELLRSLKLDDERLARVMSVSERTVRRWRASGGVVPQPRHMEHLRQLAALDPEALSRAVDSAGQDRSDASDMLDAQALRTGAAGAEGARFGALRAFEEQQQDFLRASKGKYEMWLLNFEHNPLLYSCALEESWVENIRAGINYTVFWDLDRFDQDATCRAYRQFLMASRRILEEVESLTGAGPEAQPSTEGAAAEAWAGGAIGIDVIAYETPFALPLRRERNFLRYRELVKRAIGDSSPSWADRLRLREPISLGLGNLSLEQEGRPPDGRPRGKWILRSSFWNTGLVLYKPLKLHRGAVEPRAVLVTTEVGAEFESAESRDGHFMLSLSSAADVAATAEDFETEYLSMVAELDSHPAQHRGLVGRGHAWTEFTPQRWTQRVDSLVKR